LNQKVKVLLVDNFDSFTYNIAHYLEQCGVSLTIWDNLSVKLDALNQFDGVVLSPGPGLPESAGQLLETIDRLVSLSIPTLGVCLGMQAIGTYFGATLYNQKEVKHGVATTLKLVKDSVLFENCPTTFQVGLYHSWAVDLATTDQLYATSLSATDVLMSCEHKSLPVYGVQFHPESILTEHGITIIRNFIRQIKK
jgi:anthranilate synthase component 2